MTDWHQWTDPEGKIFMMTEEGEAWEVIKRWVSYPDGHQMVMEVLSTDGEDTEMEIIMEFEVNFLTCEKCGG